MDLSYWMIFFSAALALNLAPGPDLMYIFSRTVSQGRRIGIASTLGVCSGAMVHATAAALGLSAILAASATAFTMVKLVGAAYLLYMGIKALRSAGGRFSDANLASPRVNAWQAYKSGALVDILNPKVAIFFMAFLPQFVRPEVGHASLQIFMLGVLVIVTAIVVEVSLVMVADRATGVVRSNRKLSVWLDRGLGTVFIGLGLQLAFSEHTS